MLQGRQLSIGHIVQGLFLMVLGVCCAICAGNARSSAPDPGGAWVQLIAGGGAFLLSAIGGVQVLIGTIRIAVEPLVEAIEQINRPPKPPPRTAPLDELRPVGKERQPGA